MRPTLCAGCGWPPPGRRVADSTAPPSGARLSTPKHQGGNEMKRTNRDASPLGSCQVAPVGADTGEGNRNRGDREQRTGAPSARRERVRPPRPEVDRAALDLIRRRGRDILATARRYAANLDDADDAYQRGLEILLRKAPSTREEDLVPWLKTVVIRTIRPRPHARLIGSC